jgi:hypothetical protein
MSEAGRPGTWTPARPLKGGHPDRFGILFRETNHISPLGECLWRFLLSTGLGELPRGQRFKAFKVL